MHGNCSGVLTKKEKISERSSSKDTTWHWWWEKSGWMLDNYIHNPIYKVKKKKTKQNKMNKEWEGGPAPSLTSLSLLAFTLSEWIVEMLNELQWIISV